MNDDGKDRENGKPGVGGLRTPLRESFVFEYPRVRYLFRGYHGRLHSIHYWSRFVGWHIPCRGRALEPGTVIGNRYEIIQMLGAGGMGAVYKTRDIEIGRFVAFKVIRPEFARDRNIIRAASSRSCCSHPRSPTRNVVRIFDLGEAEGMKFITMEYVDGRDLPYLMFLEHGSFSSAGVHRFHPPGVPSAWRRRMQSESSIAT